MTRILLTGCNGRMGKVITELAKEDPDIQIVAGIDVAGEACGAYPVHAGFDEVSEIADVIVDFSSPKVFDTMMDYAVAHQIPVVVCTTGLSEEQIWRIGEDSKQIAILRSANMSIGVNLLLKLVREAAAKLASEGFDIEIVERHHNQKKDAPSGTALALAESINEGLGDAYEFTFDRSQRLEKRRPKEIGISAVRGGNIPGTHEVIFAGTDELVEFHHVAYSRSIFGKGALAAARYLAGKPARLYTMADVIDS